MPRVAGTDPGTSSLDLVILDDAHAVDQIRFTPEQLQTNAAAPAEWLLSRGPFDLIAGPSGYGLPLVAAKDCTEKELQLMALVRPDEHGKGQGVAKFLSVVRALYDANLPAVFLPGVIHLPTIPAHRKINRIDLGTADKLCVAALALAQRPKLDIFCVIELGSAFTACMVIKHGQIIDGVGGTSGPVGWQSAGAWDGEVAYLLSPLAKHDLFAGGIRDFLPTDDGPALFRESLLKTIGGLKALHGFEAMILSGRLLETEADLTASICNDLMRFGAVHRLASLPGAWVKHAAQGAAIVADGLAGGRYASLVEKLQLRQAHGSVLDGLRHSRADAVRGWFGIDSRAR